MRKIKLMWHRYWATYHLIYMDELFKQEKYDDAYAHMIKWLDHTHFFFNLGGDPRKLNITY